MRTMKHWFTLPVLLAAGGGLGVGQAQVPFVLNPVHDTYVNSQYIDANYGADASVFVHSGINATKRTYLQFDLGGVALDSISGASLRMLYAQPAQTGTTIDLHHVLDDTWNESSLTWSSQPVPEAASLATASTQSGKAEVVWNLPLSLFTTDTDGRLSLLLRLQDEGLSDTATFFSKEASTPLAQPAQLTLMVPEPGQGMMLAGLGLVVWAACRRCWH